MATYYCAFGEEVNDARIETDWWETEVMVLGKDDEWNRNYDASMAAERFAAYAQDNMDMWEHNDMWDDEYAVHVRCPDGATRVFNILREYEPTFSASRVKV